MKVTLGSVLVLDQEQALRRYTEVLGFVKKADIAIGAYRWLTVAAPEAIAGVELALEPMDFEPARTCQKALFDAGIPATMGPVTAVMFEDGCGNFIHLVQPAESDSPGGA